MARTVLLKPDPETLREQLKANSSMGGWHPYHCKLVTPMYGGGVKAGEVDREMPIRASEIRGQLRFWWRIACGPFASSQEMFRRESEVWGGIGAEKPTASKVEVRVVCKKVADIELVSSLDEKNPAIKYAFGSAAINGEAKWLKPGYEFELKLRFTEYVADEVQTALCWWASFGGIGARTRRGFGAIQVSELVPVIARDVEERKGRLMVSGSGSAKPDAEWKIAVDRLFAYRQKGGIGRTERKPTPRRSFWPEPDQIRRFTNRNANGKHAPVHAAGNVFPRAAFGLPITFEFKGSPGDPPKLELHPVGDSERMASPLILRPYWNGTMWLPAALLIPGWQKALSQALKFKDQAYQPAHWPTNPASRQEKAKEIAPMKKPNGESRAADPLSAFMDFFERGQ